MSLWLFALGILALLLELRPSCSITHNAQVDAYVKKLIVEFKNDPRSRRYDNVISPPRFGDGYQDFLLPKVFIWCPMHHYGLDILCPLHNLPLKAGFFTDELQRKGPRNPRLVYDLRGNVLLIQRLYICPQEGMKHKYFSASLSIIENIPKLYGLCCFPFVMFHKSSCTKQLVDFVETQILQGVNFLAICEGIAGLNFKEFSERMACFSIYQDSNSHINKTKVDYDNFYSDSMYAFPGDKKVMELFLGNFVHKKSYYDAEMEKTARSSKIITCDHTFKVSKYICASRGSDNKYIKQFENLFIVLNEDHKVVGWRLTKSTAFEDIRDLLQEIKYSLDNPLKTVIVDDCCKVKRQYESIFPGIVVKLDLFHATQRVIKTFPKGSEWSKQISSEFGLVFREDGDCGATRCLRTPEPEVIERNLDNFIKKWKHTLNENVQTKTFRELENLRIHVKKGCISGIEPGQGTECNERLHQTLNKSLLCGATKIGPEIAIAVITLIFYALNCRREGKKHEGNSRIIPFVPLPSVKAVKVAEELEEQKLRTAHLNCGAVGDDIQLDNVWRNCEIDTSVFEGLSANAIFMLENVEDMCNDTVTALLMKNTKTMLDMLNEINNQCNDRSFNAYDLPVKQSVGDDHVLASDSDTDPSSEQDHNSLLIRNLSSFNLEIDPVEGDGDCAFRSIIKQMRKTLEWNDANGKLTDHLKDMGLAGAAIDDDVFTLRQLFVNNVQSNEYYQMLLGISVEELNAESERFREQGTFSGEVGDLVMKVCSDILQIPILVITSMPRHSYVPFIPDEMVVTSTLYVAFNAFGPGHYDGTRPMILQEQGKLYYGLNISKKKALLEGFLGTG